MPDIESTTPVIPFVDRQEVKQRSNPTKEKAKELKDIIALPPPPGEKVGFDGLQKWLALLTPEMKANNRVMIYVYRLYPSVILQKVNPQADNNIDIVFDNFDLLNEQYITETHGGGKYRLVVADQGAQKRQFGGYFEAHLDIPIQVHEPKIDYRTLNLSDKNNKGFIAWARSKGYIDQNGNVMSPIQQTTTQNASTDAVGMLKVVTDFVSKMSNDQQAQLKRAIGDGDSNKGVTEILLERMKQDDPNKQMSTMSAMIAAIGSLNKPDNSMATIVPMFTAMMQQMMEASNKQFMLMMELMKSNKPDGESNERNRITELRDLMEVARELRGGNSGNKSTAAELIEAASPIIGPALQLVGNMIAFKSGNVPKPVATPTPVITQEPTQPNNIVQPNVSVEQHPMISHNEAQQAIQQFGPIIINKLASPGYEFGIWVAEGFGDAVAMSIAKNGPDTLMQAAKNVPEFWKQVESTYGEEYLRKWLVSFCNWKEEAEKLDSEVEE